MDGGAQELEASQRLNLSVSFTGDLESRLSNTMRSIYMLSALQVEALQNSVAESKYQVDDLQSYLSKSRASLQSLRAQKLQAKNMRGTLSIFSAMELFFQRKQKQLATEISAYVEDNERYRAETDYLEAYLRHERVRNEKLLTELAVYERRVVISQNGSDSWYYDALAASDSGAEQATDYSAQCEFLQRQVSDLCRACSDLKCEIAQKRAVISSYECTGRQQRYAEETKELALECFNLRHLIEQARSQHQSKQKRCAHIFTQYEQAVDEMARFGVQNAVWEPDSAQSNYFTLREVQQMLEERSELTVQEFITLANK